MAPVAASLSVTPSLVWTRTAGSELVPLNRPGIALSGDNIIISTADVVTAVERHTGVVSWRYQNLASHQYYSPPVVDSAGNIYVTRDSAIDKIEPSGTARVLIGFEGTSESTTTEFGVFSQEVILSPTGILFHQSNSGALRAIRTADGTEVWSVKNSPSRPSAGAADVIVVGPDLRDASTGNVLGQVIGSNGARLWIDSQLTQGTVLSYSGFLGGAYDDNPAGMGHVELLSPCAKIVWSASSTGQDFKVDAVGLQGIVFVTDIPRASNDPFATSRVFAVRVDGVKVGEAFDTIGRVIAVGADGTVYVRDCSPNTADRWNLIALGHDLVEKWRLPLTGQCGNTNAVLTEDGMLYFGRHASPGATEIIAIQTPSPGLARSAWPTWRHDNRATAWLAP